MTGRSNLQPFVGELYGHELRALDERLLPGSADRSRGVVRPMPMLGQRCVILVVILTVAPGCFTLQSKTWVQRIAVETHPPGAWIVEPDATGRRLLGRAPMIVEKQYSVTVKRFKHVHWIWPALFSGGVALGAYITSQGGEGLGTGILGMCVPGLVTTLLLDISGEVHSGEVVERIGGPLRLTALSDGYVAQTLRVPSSVTRVALKLRPEARRHIAALRPPPAAPPPAAPPPAVPPAAVPQAAVPLPAVPAPWQPIRAPGRRAGNAEGAVVAVFDIEDATTRLKPKVVDQLTDYLATKLTEEASYRVVPRHQLRARLIQEKKQGYTSCYEESCQIELGKAVAAQKSFAAKLLQIGERCAISATLYDLKSETAEKATSVRTDCSENALMEATEALAKRLR